MYYESQLYHHGVRGQKWGKKNGPPYPLSRKEARQQRKAERKETREKIKKVSARPNEKYSLKDTYVTNRANTDVTTAAKKEGLTYGQTFRANMRRSGDTFTHPFKNMKTSVVVSTMAVGAGIGFLEWYLTNNRGN